MAAPAPIPLAGWADSQLSALRESVRELLHPPRATLAQLTGPMLLGERATANQFRVPGRISTGGGCRLYQTGNGLLALNLAREDDRLMLPALLKDAAAPTHDDDFLELMLASHDAAALVARGRDMGLALAHDGEAPINPPSTYAIPSERPAPRQTGRAPLVLDLTQIWAGPLAAHLLWQAGMDVIKVESPARPDMMRGGDPALFARLNQGKANVALDIRQADDRAALLRLIAQADVIIESARPRGLRQWGIVAEDILARAPGKLWVNITAHGLSSRAEHWVGFGDDCGVAGGLTAALHRATGSVGFVGDAIADPLTGLFAARHILDCVARVAGGHLVLAMSAIAAHALDWQIAHDGADGLAATLRQWAAAVGTPIAAVPLRDAGPVAALGADNARWLGSASC